MKKSEIKSNEMKINAEMAEMAGQRTIRTMSAIKSSVMTMLTMAVWRSTAARKNLSSIA